MERGYQWKALSDSLSENWRTWHSCNQWRSTVGAKKPINQILDLALGVDEEIKLDGVPARAVIRKRRVDIAIDGYFVRTGEPYRPRPKWMMVFIVLCLAMGIAGGVLPLLLGIGAAALCRVFALLDLPGFVRVIICIGVTIVAWVLLFVLAIGLQMILT